MAAERPNRPLRSILKKTSTATLIARAQSPPAGIVDADENQDASPPWRLDVNDEGFRSACISFVLCVGFVAAVAVSSYFFYASRTGGEGISTPATTTEGAENATTGALSPRSPTPAAQNKVSERATFQDQALTAASRSGGEDVAREDTAEEDREPATYAAAMATVHDEWGGINFTTTYKAHLNASSGVVADTKGDDYTREP